MAPETSTAPQEKSGTAQQGGGGGGDLFGNLRNAAGRNPATARLFEEAEKYARSRGKQLLENMGQGNLGGGAATQAVGKGVAQLAEGASPIKAAGATAAEGVKAAGSGVGGTVKKALGALTGKRGKGGGRKATTIIEDMDVGVPVSVAYNQWTQFEHFHNFMKGVEAIDQKDEATANWRVKIGPSRRQWEAHITEQIPDRRIAWTSQGAKGSTKGTVTFHPLCDDCTKVLVVLEYFPQGPVEHIGNAFRVAGRRTRLDLKLFRRFVTMEGHETGAWRGEIRDGKPVEAGEGGPNGEHPQEGEDGQDGGQQPQGAGRSQEGGDREGQPQGRSQQSDDGGRQPQGEQSQEGGEGHPEAQLQGRASGGQSGDQGGGQQQGGQQQGGQQQGGQQQGGRQQQQQGEQGEQETPEIVVARS